MEKPIRLIFLIIFSLSLISCGGARQAISPQEPSVDAIAPGIAEKEGVFEEAQAEANFDQRFAGEAAPVEPLVIRNANLALVVEDPVQSIKTIGKMAQDMGGFVVHSNISQNTYGEQQLVASQASITIRVPSERLDEALDQIKEEALEIRSENIRGEDVTQQYTDLQSRLRNLEAAEEQLREIMASAVKTEDVLRVFQDLRQVREEIEVIKGQMKYFEESARLSAISVELIPDALAQPLQIGRWQPQGTAKEALETLIRSLQFLADAGIWLVICILPILVIFGVPGYFAGRAILRYRRERKAKSEPKSK